MNNVPPCDLEHGELLPNAPSWSRSRFNGLMGADEEGTLAALKACRRELIDPKIAEHRGRLVKTTGDGALVEFASAVRDRSN